MDLLILIALAWVSGSAQSTAAYSAGKATKAHTDTVKSVAANSTTGKVAKAAGTATGAAAAYLAGAGSAFKDKRAKKRLARAAEEKARQESEQFERLMEQRRKELEAFLSTPLKPRPDLVPAPPNHPPWVPRMPDHAPDVPEAEDLPAYKDAKVIPFPGPAGPGTSPQTNQERTPQGEPAPDSKPDPRHCPDNPAPTEEPQGKEEPMAAQKTKSPVTSTEVTYTAAQGMLQAVAGQLDVCQEDAQKVSAFEQSALQSLNNASDGMSAEVGENGKAQAAIDRVKEVIAVQEALGKRARDAIEKAKEAMEKARGALASTEGLVKDARDDANVETVGNAEFYNREKGETK